MAEDIGRAVRAARQASDDGPWGRMAPSERGRVIRRIGDLIGEHAEELAQLESLDDGKPYPVARAADIPLAADLFHYMAGWATKLEPGLPAQRAVLASVLRALLAGGVERGPHNCQPFQDVSDV